MAETIEIVNIRVKEGVADEQFRAENHKMETEYLAKLKGFIQRDTGLAADGGYVIVLHWESPEDAQASMDAFVGNPATDAFTSILDMDSFRMTRYEQIGHIER